MLFRVEGTVVLLCGTMHLLPEGQKLPDKLFAAVASVEECFFESDFRSNNSFDVGKYPDGKSLQEAIAPELFEATETLWKSLGLSPKQLNRLKPWSVVREINAKLLIDRGATIDSGADMQLLRESERLGKSISFLEDTESVLNIFDSAPVAEQISGLSAIVSDPERPVTAFNKLHRAWAVWDTTDLTGVLNFFLDRAPKLYRGLIYDRNRQWLPCFLDAINRNVNALFVVGSLHLVGMGDSCQGLIGEHGYKVRRIPFENVIAKQSTP